MTDKALKPGPMTLGELYDALGRHLCYGREIPVFTWDSRDPNGMPIVTIEFIGADPTLGLPDRILIK